MRKSIYLFLCFLICILLFAGSVIAAEVLQVSSSSLLLIGDNNRNYKVRIACIDVHSNLEETAKIWLRKELPRNSKINLKPIGFEDGVLFARVVDIQNKIDLGNELAKEGLAKLTC
tara:strand:- start:77 stop:424 length:348 start_codon:yes stop_codon:yes gene_type:complete